MPSFLVLSLSLSLSLSFSFSFVLVCTAFDALAKADADEAAHAAERLRRIRAATERARRGAGRGDTPLERHHRERGGSYELSQSLVDAAAADASGALLVTWANAHHAEFALNWIAHARGAGIGNFLVGCLDDELIRVLEERAGAGAHLFRVPESASFPSSSFSSSSSSSSRNDQYSSSKSSKEDIGWGSAGFHALGRAKVSLARLLVERHGADVLVSDVDAVWLRDPFPYLRRFPEADVLASSDALAPTRDRRGGGVGGGRRAERRGETATAAAASAAAAAAAPDPLERWPAAAAAANIGVVFFRSPRSVDFLREWEETLLRSDEEEEKKGSGEKQWDQNVFNDLFRRGMVTTTTTTTEQQQQIEEGASEDGARSEAAPALSPPPPPPITASRPDGLFPAYDNSLLFGILPVDLFASGHTFFVQRLPERTGAGVGLFDSGGGESGGGGGGGDSSPSGPFVVHATFQFSGDEGKRHRLRERYLWAVDGGDGGDGDEGEGDGEKGGGGLGRGRGKKNRESSSVVASDDDDDDDDSGSGSSITNYYDPPGGLLVVEPPPPSVLGPAIAAAAEERERVRWMQRRQMELEEEEQEEEEEEGEGKEEQSGGRNLNATAAAAAIPTDPAALFSAHFALVHLQLRRVVAGLALASALNRTLVLPRLWCGADRWFAPHLGSIPGAAGPMLPFRCPADHVLDLEVMERMRKENNKKKKKKEQKVGGEGAEEEEAGADSGSSDGNFLFFPPPPVREAGLLLNPRTPLAVREDVLHVVPCEPTTTTTDDDCDGGGGAASAGKAKEKKKKSEEAGGGAAPWRKKLAGATSSSSSSRNHHLPSTLRLRSGLDDAHLAAALAPHSHRRVLSFADPTASFGGFAADAAADIAAAAAAADAGAAGLGARRAAASFERSARAWASTWCCVARHPGHVWYDAFAERVPHVDRWGRAWDRPWAAVAGP